MLYEKSYNKIIIHDLAEFNVRQIFDCGQIFRYGINNDEAVVISRDKMAKLLTYDDKIEIITDNVDYFEHFFDLETSYKEIKKTLSKDKYLLPCCKYGYGIRILKQDLFEMIVSFIVSANNNIKRIKNSVNYLSEKFGSRLTSKVNSEQYYAFPTLQQLKSATINDYTNAGLGYRAPQMYKTIQHLTDDMLNDFRNMTKNDKIKFLISLSGVGTKVANCVMLFSESEMSSFPVDTWIEKIYNHITKSNLTDRNEIEKRLVKKYKNLSGYAQQYFFYYYREHDLL